MITAQLMSTAQAGSSSGYIINNCVMKINNGLTVFYQNTFEWQ